jgi:cell fate regulator YaaT (PSP1 superfamily)
MKVEINQYDKLTTDRIRFENEKVLFQFTEREEEFRTKISEISEELKLVSQNIKARAKILNDYELECNN